ncbi:MAG TPA: Stp1/IreP family PP2C-type Ser/Thr phosphatase [Coriobacteriia bacterium]
MNTTAGLISAHAELPELSWAFRSHPGVVRPENEDCVGAYAPAEAVDHPRLFVVADGMGGHAAGEVASRLAVESLLREWTTATPAPLNQALRSAARAANGAVFAASLDQEHRGMGTTLTALALAGSEASIAHVGDSRAYHVRAGQCSQLTSDHSRIGEMLRMRLITPEQAAHHPARSQLTRSLGFTPAVQVDLVRTDIRPLDTFVLCSDGLWDLVSRNDIAEATAEKTPNEAAEVLLEQALERGAPDNVTLVVVRVLSELPMPAGVRARSRLAFLRR